MSKRRKTKVFSFQGFDLAHYKATEAYTRAVSSLFDKATDDIANAASRENYNPDKPFSFDDYPKAKAQLQKTIKGLAGKMQAVIETASRKQWLFACQKNDEFIASIFDTTKLTKGQLKKYQDRNLDALQAFQQRKVGGMDLSERVWKYTQQYKEQIEAGLDVGLGEGRSAQQLSRDLRQNLKDPNRLFRRVRDKRGNLQLSKSAKAFHPGQGVYRSSYKNAMRLTRSEINMSYRESDHLRWQQLDFVLGFEVRRSNREPKCNCELCERLVGRYPKWFKFKGWHPQCLCDVIPILEDFYSKERSDDRVARMRAALRGEEYKKYVSKALIKDLPDNFKEWASENEERQKNWASTPYFIKDNFVDGDLSKGLMYIQKQKPLTILERAAIRHKGRTEEEIRNIKTRYWDRELQRKMPNISEAERTALTEHWIAIENKTGWKKGKMMTIEEADKQSANPNYHDGRQFQINCQTCSPAYVLRLWGFDVVAKGNTKGSLSEYLSYQRSFDAWKNADGTDASPILQKDWLMNKGYQRMTEKRWKEYFEDSCKENGTYILTIGWKGGGGHATIIQRTDEGLYYIEPQYYDSQKGAKRSILELCEQGSQTPNERRGILRVDNKIFVEKYLSIFEKGS